MITPGQIEKFKEFTGMKPSGDQRQGEFWTYQPFNDREWKHSPWKVQYQFDESNKYLVCAMSHKMTNTRFAGWDEVGRELEPGIVEKYFDVDDGYSVILI